MLFGDATASLEKQSGLRIQRAAAFGKGRYPGNPDHRGQGPDPDWYEESQTRSRQDLTPILSRQRNPNVPLWRAPCFRVAARVTHWRNGETEAPASRLCPLMGGKTRLLIRWRYRRWWRYRHQVLADMNRQLADSLHSPTADNPCGDFPGSD